MVCYTPRSSVAIKKLTFVSLGGNTAEQGKWPPSKNVGSTMADIGF